MLSCFNNPVYRFDSRRFIYLLGYFHLRPVSAADRLTGVHSAQVMSQSMPWIAQEAGFVQEIRLGLSPGFHPVVAGGNRRDIERRRGDSGAPARSAMCGPTSKVSPIWFLLAV